MVAGLGEGIGRRRASGASALPAGRKGRGAVVAAAVSFLGLYLASPEERIAMIREGIPAAEAKRIVGELFATQGAALEALKLSTATVNKKAKLGERLSPEESERVFGIARLVGQVEAMVAESGDATGFDARAWMARWLSEPLPALGGARPVEFMDTMEGQGLVSAALSRMQSGAYG